MATSDTHFGRYELRGELGWGGFATVYLAWDPLLHRQVALKALLPHLARDPGLRRRFLAEAQALARVRHGNIVPVHDVGEAEGRPFFAMAFIDGETLAELLGRRHGLPVDEAIGLVQSLASALDELHSAGLVHRDVKPQNVMLDKSGRLVLMDLGIARTLDSTSLTQTGMTVGTPHYMAPEQVQGAPVEPAADIYALGLLTYQMLADRPPFLGDTPTVLHAQVYEQPPPLQQFRSDLPDSVSLAVEAALAKEPALRPSSAGRFAALLGESTETTALINVADRDGIVEQPTVAQIPGRAGRAQHHEPLQTGMRTEGMTGEVHRGRAGERSVLGVFASHRGVASITLGLLVVLLLAGGLIVTVPGIGTRPGERSASSNPGSLPPVGQPTSGERAAAPPGAAPPALQPPPSEDCSPRTVPTGAMTACSIFLDGDVAGGATIAVEVSAPASAAISACHSESGGLGCTALAGRRATVACRLHPCRTGAQFTIDVTASGSGALAMHITLTARGGAHSFNYPNAATFGSGPR